MRKGLKRGPYGSRKETSSADATYSSTNYEGHRVGSRAADDRAELEEYHADEEDTLDGEDGVYLAEQQLEGTRGEEVGAPVPADVA